MRPSHANPSSSHQAMSFQPPGPHHVTSSMPSAPYQGHFQQKVDTLPTPHFQPQTFNGNPSAGYPNVLPSDGTFTPPRSSSTLSQPFASPPHMQPPSRYPAPQTNPTYPSPMGVHPSFNQVNPGRQSAPTHETNAPKPPPSSSLNQPISTLNPLLNNAASHQLNPQFAQGSQNGSQQSSTQGFQSLNAHAPNLAPLPPPTQPNHQQQQPWQNSFGQQQSGVAGYGSLPTSSPTHSTLGTAAMPVQPLASTPSAVCAKQQPGENNVEQQRSNYGPLAVPPQSIPAQSSPLGAASTLGSYNQHLQNNFVQPRGEVVPASSSLPQSKVVSSAIPPMPPQQPVNSLGGTAVPQHPQYGVPNAVSSSAISHSGAPSRPPMPPQPPVPSWSNTAAQHQQPQFGSPGVASSQSKSNAVPQTMPPMPPQPTVGTATAPGYAHPPPGASYQAQSPPCYPPMPPQAQPNQRPPGSTGHYQLQSGRGLQQPQTQSHSFFRQPGTPSTLLEWSQVTAPVSLLHDKQLLPTDATDLAPEPATNYHVNCDPDVVRCTLTSVPVSSKLLSKCRLPFGLVMHPFRDLTNLQTINSAVIVRCRSCRTYINPFVTFTDSGRRWRCPVCFMSNSVPDDFFYDPITQSYGDPARRPEIRSATVEFIAPAEYMMRPPQPATYLFMLDVSHNAVNTGYLNVACNRLASLLHKIPGDCRRQVAFITFGSSVHLYKLSGASMRMMICPDLEEAFIPDHEGLFNRIEDSIDVLKDFLTKLPSVFGKTNDIGNCLGAALQTAMKLIGSAGGRITVFNTCIPSTGPGALSHREDAPGQAGTSVENLGPAIDFYKSLALDCSSQQIAIDLFSLNSRYSDLATLSGACRYSSGSLYHYPGFFEPSSEEPETSDTSGCTQGQSQSPEAALTVKRFKNDLNRYLTRKIGFEAVMRIRCTRGLSIQSFHGSCYVRSVDLMALPNANPDTGFAVQLGIDESLDKYNSVCIQTAILYTSAIGDRRIRVHTLCLPVVQNPSEVFRGADQGAIACLVAKLAVDRAMKSGISAARESLTNAVADALSAYSGECGDSTAVSTAISVLSCPVTLRLLAVYVCGMLASRAFSLSLPVTLDDRSAALDRVKLAPPDELLPMIYPRLYAIDHLATDPVVTDDATLLQKAGSLSLNNTDSPSYPSSTSSADSSVSISSCDANQLPGQLHLTKQSITPTGVFLLDMGDVLFLLVGAGPDYKESDGSSKVLLDMLGISSPMELPESGGPFGLSSLLSEDNRSMSLGRRRFIALVRLIQSRRPMGSTLLWLRNDAPETLRARFLSALVEDQTKSSLSYHELLLSIQSLLKSG